MSKIIITSRKIEEIKKYIKSFLDQKVKVDSKIRDYAANDVDFYKEILLEDYLAGILIMLRALNIKYTLDDKQVTFDMEFTNLQQEYDIPQEEIKLVFSKLKNKVSELLNQIDEEKFPKDRIEFEKNILRNYYALLGATTIANKLGLKFYVKMLGDSIFDGQILEQIYKDDDEVEDYIGMTEKINEITDAVFEKMNIIQSLNVMNWKRSITTNENNISFYIRQLTQKFNFNVSLDKFKGLENLENRLQDDKKIFDDLLVDLEEKVILINAKHRNLCIDFANEYLNNSIKNV